MSKKELVNGFLSEAIVDMINSGISIDIPQKKTLGEHGDSFTGEFLYEDKVFRCAARSHSFLSTFVHEYSHFLQYKTGFAKRHAKKFANIERLWDWLSGDEFSAIKVNKFIEDAIFVELDCDKRAVELILEYNLPIDMEQYIKESNAYIWFYHYVKKYRSWAKKSAYKDKNVLKFINLNHESHYFYKKIENLDPFAQRAFDSFMKRNKCSLKQPRIELE